MENILNEGLNLRSKMSSYTNFATQTRLGYLLKTQLNVLFMKRIVTSEMHQNRTGSSNSLSGETFHRSLIKLTIEVKTTVMS